MSCRIYRTQSEWTSRLLDVSARQCVKQGRLPDEIPLPPYLADHPWLNAPWLSLSDGCIGRPTAGEYPEVVLSMGSRSRDAGLFLGAFAGASTSHMKHPAALLDACRELGAFGTARVVVVLDPSEAGEPLLGKMQQICDMLDGITVGFVYAISGEAAFSQVMKMLWMPRVAPEGDVLLVSLLGESQLQIRKGRLNVLLGEVPDDAAVLLDRAHSCLVLASHGDGFCYDVGSIALCSRRDGEESSEILCPSCFHTAACTRPRRTRKHVAEIKSDLIVLMSCWGSFDSIAGFPHERTASSVLLCSPYVRTLVASTGVARLSQRDPLSLVGSLALGRTVGECVKLNNLMRRDTGSPLVVFGTPGARLSTGSFSTAIPQIPLTAVETDGLHAGLSIVLQERPSSPVGTLYNKLGACGRDRPPAHVVETCVTIAPVPGNSGKKDHVAAVVATPCPTAVRPLRVEERVAMDVALYDRLAKEAEFAEMAIHAMRKECENPAPLIRAQMKLSTLQMASRLHSASVSLVGDVGLVQNDLIRSGVSLLEEWTDMLGDLSMAALKWKTGAFGYRHFDDRYLHTFRRTRSDNGRCISCHGPANIMHLEALWRPDITRMISSCALCGMPVVDFPVFASALIPRLDEAVVCPEESVVCISISNPQSTHHLLALGAALWEFGGSPWLPNNHHIRTGSLEPGGVLSMKLPFATPNPLRLGSAAVVITGFIDSSYVYMHLFITVEKGANGREHVPRLRAIAR